MLSNDFDRAVYDLTRLQYQLDNSLKLAALRIAFHGHQQAIKYSSGPVKAQEMRKTRPFSKLRHAAPLLPPDIMNAQTGAFRDAWLTSGKRDDDGYDIQFRNDNFVTQFLGGTRYMHERPIEDTLRQIIGGNAEHEVEDAVGRLMQSYGN